MNLFCFYPTWSMGTDNVLYLCFPFGVTRNFMPRTKSRHPCKKLFFSLSSTPLFFHICRFFVCSYSTSKPTASIVFWALYIMPLSIRMGLFKMGGVAAPSIFILLVISEGALYQWWIMNISNSSYLRCLLISEHCPYQQKRWNETRDTQL